MASFGRYQTVREIHRSGFTVLYSGRTAASPEAKYAIKVFQPSSLLLETEQVKNQSDLFLNSARVQQKTSVSGAQYWAPIHKCDLIPDGAFYATDKYDRSLQQLIDTNIKLTAQALNKIIESVAKGLVELKKACGRPHGNLKATNILIAGEGDISQTTIVLSDPLPDEHIDTAVHWDGDLRDIAEFIYQLVMHRPSPAIDSWQAPDSKEWAKLGKQAQEWRNLCNRLLVSHMKPGTMTVEILIRELARLKKIKPVLSTRRLLVAIGFVVIVGAAIIFLFKPVPEAGKMEDWNQLLTENEDWIGKLRQQLVSNRNQREELWKKNPHLKIIVENIINDKKASFPYKVAADNNLLVKDLTITITNQEDLDKYDITLSKTNTALKAVEIIKYFFFTESDPNSYKFFDPNLPQDKQEYQKWPELAQIKQVSVMFEDRGWQRSAKYLEKLVDDIKPDPNIAENVDKILQVQPSLDDIRSCWTEIENNEKIIANSSDLLFTRFSDYIKKEPDFVLEDATKFDINNFSKNLYDELQNRIQLSGKLANSIKNNWQKLEENQKIIIDTGNTTLAKFPDYIQSKLDSADLDTLGEKLQEISSSAGKLAKSVKDNWKRLLQNQEIIKGTGNPTLANFPDYIQLKLDSADRNILSGEADLDSLGEKLQEISISAVQLASFITDNWQEFEDKQKKIIDTGDPILAKFPDYIQLKLDSADRNILSGEAELDILHRELQDVNSLADTLAKFDWQKIDKTTFLNDHGNDFEETLTENSFTKRLNIAKTYSYLVSDPRDKLNDLVKQTRNNIKQAQEHNPQPARDCANNLDKLLPNIKELEEFRGIKKEEDQINKKINDLQPAIVKINETAISLIEAPEDWLRGISEDSRIASSEALNEKWIELRDKAINGHTADKLDMNKTLYRELRERMKGTKENLVKLDGELIRELPTQIDAELKEKDWNSKLKELYDEEKNKTINSIVENIQLKDEIPDINAPSFRQFKQRQFSIFQQLQVDLGGILDEFNKIEDGLDACYLLDQKLPATNETIRLLWSKWEEKIPKDPPIDIALAELTKRIENLVEIEKSDDRDRLGRIATDPGSQNEAVYAAWIRLGKLTDPKWPNTDEEWKKEQEIQDILREKLPTIKGGNRIIIVSKLDEDGPKREKIFRKVKIEDYKTQIADKASQDEILIAFEAFQPAKDNLNDIIALESLAKDIAEFVSDSDWPTQFRTDLFRDKSDIHKSLKPITMNNVGIIIQTWRKEVEYYRKLKPENILRKKYSWDEKTDKIEGLLNKELDRKQAGESFDKLKALKSKFDALNVTIKNMQSLPAINLYKDQIDKSGDYWENLLEIERSLKPEICNHLELENEQLIFASNNLHPKFEPIFDADSKMPVTLKDGWEDIRKAVNEKQKVWIDFFHSIDSNDKVNSGWPKYARSTKDPTVILRFIPAGPGNPEPFYMATHEITNAQYRLFLETTGAINPAGYPQGWSCFTEPTDPTKPLIFSKASDLPPSAIKWNSSQKTFTVVQADANVPVTYVSYFGAQSYAESLGAQLPTATQHEYACRAGSNKLVPWDDDSEIPNYAHVRAGLWKVAKDAYNSKVGTFDVPPPAPVGAVKPIGFTPNKKLEPNSDNVVHNNETTYNTYWPTYSANKPNVQGLYDMIGNVWEWCRNGTQSVICGGSCLAPPKYIFLTDPTNYSVEFSNPACDVGFRIIVPAK